MLPTIVFYGRDGAAAKALADEIRKGKAPAQVRDATAFCFTKEPADKVLALPCVDAQRYDALWSVYGDLLSRHGLQDEAPADEPVSAAADDLDGKTDAELRQIIADRLGEKPHHRAGRDKLLDMLKAAQ